MPRERVYQMVFAGTECGVSDWRTRLKAIEQDCREDGWDSYAAGAVTDEAICAARRLCESLDVVPTNRGGIQVAMAVEALAFEIGPTGRVVNVYADIAEAEAFNDASTHGYTP